MAMTPHSAAAAAAATAAAGNRGSSCFHAAKIVARRALSPTVVALDLEVLSSGSSNKSNNQQQQKQQEPQEPFSFQPGQWLDFMVPPHSWVGGFSPATVPSDLPRLTIAVKRSNHPPSRWVHSSNDSESSEMIGRRVRVRAGGTCVLDTSRDSLLWSRPVVFCAGGIGISPLLSLYRQWADLIVVQRQQKHVQGPSHHHPPPPRASFLYSVSTEEELVFERELLQVATAASSSSSAETQSNQHCCEHSNLVFTLTQQSAWTAAKKRQLESLGGVVQCRTGRYLRQFLEAADPASVFYLCGPPALLDEGATLLRQRQDVDPSNVHFERWW